MLRYWQYCHHDRFYSSCDMPMRADPAVPNSLVFFFFLVLSDATARLARHLILNSLLYTCLLGLPSVFFRIFLASLCSVFDETLWGSAHLPWARRCAQITCF